MVLGLPDDVNTCLFDLDGVLTKTAKVHAAAWKEMFESAGYGPFTPADYEAYVDGKPRDDGVRSFLQSRGIERKPDEVHDLGLHKNETVLRLIRERGVEAYEGSVRYVHAARDAGLRRAVVSSSTNAHDVLIAAGIEWLFDEIVDGVVAERERLQGKPAPDTFLEGARLLGAQPLQAAVFEDALAGVAAGKAGGFGLVVGVDRTGHADALYDHGAEIVVEDLAELL